MKIAGGILAGLMTAAFVNLAAVQPLASAPLSLPKFAGPGPSTLLMAKNDKHKGNQNHHHKNKNRGPQYDGDPSGGSTSESPPAGTTSKCNVLWGDYCNVPAQQ